jgi:glyoxylase-like metal-dependent hydrolase (beta-lactamase superfamily II)
VTSATSVCAATTPDVEEVAEGVHRIPVVLPDMALHSVNVYALVDADGVDLIDCGMQATESEDALVTGLARLGVGVGDLRNVFVTHHHVDHYSLATKLRKDHGFTLHLGEGERENLLAVRHVIATQAERSFVADMRRVGFPSSVAALAEPGVPDIDPETWADPDRWIDDGATLRSRSRQLIAIATPGHTKGHLVFRDDQEGLLFAGDHILSRITPSIGFEASGRSHRALRDYLDSLTLILQMPDTQLLPAHGPTQPSAHARAKELLAHHEQRLAATLEALETIDGPDTAYNVARRLPWTRHNRAFDALDPFNQYLAAAETAAHLDVLAHQRLARMAGASEPHLYQAGGPSTRTDDHSDEEGDHESLGD